MTVLENVHSLRIINGDFSLGFNKTVKHGVNILEIEAESNLEYQFHDLDVETIEQVISFLQSYIKENK